MTFTRPKAAQIDFDVTNISDPLIRLNSSQSGSANKDSGIVIERGSDTNVAIIYDESTDQFAVINTTETGTTSGNVTITSYADIKANAFYGDGSNLTGIAGSYGDSDVATYLSANGYATSSSIIASITDSAPSTLNTLNELAAALGDDANFSTTVTTSIATKLPLAGGTMTGALTLNGAPTSSLHAATKAYVDSSVTGAGGGDVVDDTTPQLGGDLQSNGNDINFGDNDKTVFGAGSDLQIYHDGSNSYISEGGTGNLFLGATNLFMRSSTGETYIGAVQDGAVTLYHNNAAKLATTSTGVDVTGTVTASVFSGIATSARYADLAERYTADADYEPGTVMRFGGEQEMTICTSSLDRRQSGIVTTNPAHLMNDGLEAEHTVDIALQGRVPCKVEGYIRKGDMMVPSEIDGHARAWREEGDPPYGTVIGKSLEDKDSRGTDTIEVVVGLR